MEGRILDACYGSNDWNPWVADDDHLYKKVLF